MRYQNTARSNRVVTKAASFAVSLGLLCALKPVTQSLTHRADTSANAISRTGPPAAAQTLSASVADPGDFANAGCVNVPWFGRVCF